jgi:putative membrane protein
MPTLRFLTTAGAVLGLLAVVPAGGLNAQTPQQDSAARKQWPNVPRLPSRTSPTSTTTSTTVPATTADTGRLAAAADSTTIRDASLGSLWEVRLGNIAQQKGSSQAVKDFGKRMVTDHTSLWNQWASLAKQNGLPVTSTLQADQQQSASQLNATAGADFDRAYMTAMVQAHQRDAGMFQQVASSAQSSAVRQLAASSEAVVQQHLTMAEQVAGQVGAPTTVATNPTVPTPTTPTPAPSGNPNPTNGNRNGVNKNLRADGQYVTEVAYGHIMETRLAQLAQRKATDPQVKQFADRMYNHFNSWMGRWSDLASRSGYSFNPNMGPKHQEKIDRLQKASRNQFDRTYLDIVIENLNSMIPYFQKEGHQVKTAQVRNMVDQELPILQQNVQEAERLNRSSQANGKAKGKDKSLSSH